MRAGERTTKNDKAARSGWFDLDGEYLSIRKALRLLSGTNEPRDVKRARSILARLSHSRNREIAHDANAVLREGLEFGWFDENVPSYAQLERIAKGSMEYDRTWRKRTRIAQVILGLLLIALLGMVYLMITGTIPEFLQ